MAKKKAKKKAATKKAKKMEMLLVGSKTKEALRGKNFNVSSDAIEALNVEVHALIKKMQDRCAANKRKTVRGSDA